MSRRITADEARRIMARALRLMGALGLAVLDDGRLDRAELRRALDLAVELVDEIRRALAPEEG